MKKMYMCRHDVSTSLLFDSNVEKLISVSLELCQRVPRWTEDGAEWRRDNDLDFPSSKSVTCLAVIHRYHSAVREVQPWVWCVVSHSCSSQAGKTTNFFITLSLVLTFLLDAAHLQKSSKSDASLSSQASRKETVLYNVNFCFWQICIFQWTESGKAPFPDLSVRCAHHWQRQF